MASSKEDFGVRVRELRERTGLSQEHFGDAIHVSRGQMGKLENGKANPTLETIVKIAIGLEMTLAQLFESLNKRPIWPHTAPPSSDNKPKKHGGSA
jgi:transcriptional regulator with XRE-family HTH domain